MGRRLHREVPSVEQRFTSFTTSGALKTTCWRNFCKSSLEKRTRGVTIFHLSALFRVHSCLRRVLKSGMSNLLLGQVVYTASPLHPSHQNRLLCLWRKAASTYLKSIVLSQLPTATVRFNMTTAKYIGTRCASQPWPPLPYVAQYSLTFDVAKGPHDHGYANAS